MKRIDVVAAVLWMAVSALVVPLASAAQSPVRDGMSEAVIGQGRANNSDGDVVGRLGGGRDHGHGHVEQQ